MWIFGYGSIVWKPEIRFVNRLEGHVKGYIRRFWQLSEDHRGVPGNVKSSFFPREHREKQLFVLARSGRNINSYGKSICKFLDDRSINSFDSCIYLHI